MKTPLRRRAPTGGTARRGPKQKPDDPKLGGENGDGARGATRARAGDPFISAKSPFRGFLHLGSFVTDRISCPSFFHPFKPICVVLSQKRNGLPEMSQRMFKSLR